MAVRMFNSFQSWTGWRPRMAAALAIVLTASQAGCVERRLMVRTNPPGALLYVDDHEIGITPCATSFIYYGTRKIRLVKDGYETLVVNQPIPAPWYEFFPADFVAENFVPGHIRDQRVLTYDLRSAIMVPNEQLSGRADALRAAVKAEQAAQGYVPQLPRRGTPAPAIVPPTPGVLPTPGYYPQPQGTYPVYPQGAYPRQGAYPPGQLIRPGFIRSPAATRCRGPRRSSHSRSRSDQFRERRRRRTISCRRRGIRIRRGVCEGALPKRLRAAIGLLDSRTPFDRAADAEHLGMPRDLVGEIAHVVENRL